MVTGSEPPVIRSAPPLSSPNHAALRPQILLHSNRQPSPLRERVQPFEGHLAMMYAPAQVPQKFPILAERAVPASLGSSFHFFQHRLDYSERGACAKDAWRVEMSFLC